MADHNTSSTGRAGRGLFLRKFLQQGTKIASIAPSSRALARALCTHVRADQPQTIIELGAGDGAVTRVAAGRMHAESRLIAIEQDADFAERLRAAVPGATVVTGDVKDLAAHLSEQGVEGSEIDLVISGLPTPSLPRAVSEAVFDWLNVLPEAVTYSQLTVMPWVYKPLYQRLFDEVTFTPVLRNLPPGGAYHCRRLKPNYRDHLPGK
jgi:phosphatidylethanolamine/phosphatidyl-N-methylethanolamine N-methyltransferase